MQRNSRRVFFLLLCAAILYVVPVIAQDNLEHVAHVSVNLSCTPGDYQISGPATRACTVKVTYDAAPGGQALPDPDFPDSFTGTITVKGWGNLGSGGGVIARFLNVTVNRGATATRTFTSNCQPLNNASRTLRNSSTGENCGAGGRTCHSVSKPPCPRGCGGRIPCPPGCGGSVTVCTDNPVTLRANYTNSGGFINKDSGTQRYLCLPGSGPTQGSL